MLQLGKRTNNQKQQLTKDSKKVQLVVTQRYSHYSNQSLLNTDAKIFKTAANSDTFKQSVVISAKCNNKIAFFLNKS